jgi:hypothetical protein
MSNVFELRKSMTLRWKCIHDALWTTEYKGFIVVWDGSMCSCFGITKSSNSILHVLHDIDELLKKYY